MLKPIEHLFPTVTSGVEHYINYSDADGEYMKGEIIFTVIKHAAGVRFHHRIYSTINFCHNLRLTDEECLLWFLKFGELLPRFKKTLDETQV